MLDQISRKYSRTGIIRMAGAIGIALNLLMAGLKLLIGTLANSIAIISDAVNNLTDAMSSIVTLAGLKLSQRQPDHKHPLGYGRIEYISAMAIAVIVCIAGYEFLKSSIDRILHPESVHFTVLQLILLFAAILMKLFLSRLNVVLGKAADSTALIASGTEAMIDVLASSLTIVTAIIAKFTGWQIDGYTGLLLSVFILYTGINLIKETISQIIGERPEKETLDLIREDLGKYSQILGSYDFIIHSYGPVTRLGTANLEFADTLSAKEVYEIMQMVQRDIFQGRGIYFTFGLYAVNSYDTEAYQMNEQIQKILKELKYVVGLHAFYLDKKNLLIGFDAVVSFEMQDFKKASEEITALVKREYPQYEVKLNIDLDYA